MSQTPDELQPDNDPQPSPPNPSRRRFLGVAGAGAGAAVVVGGPSVAGALGRGRRRGHDATDQARGRGRNTPPASAPAAGMPDRFTRLFEPNRVNRNQRQEMSEALIELSRPGGLLDANDQLDGRSDPAHHRTRVEPRKP